MDEVKIRLTPEQRAILKAAAEARGLALAAYIRMVALRAAEGER